MLWVNCPNCGKRPFEEFRYGNVFPTTPDSITDPDARNVDFAWMQDNIEGVLLERWFHESGCRRWFTARRGLAMGVLAASMATGQLVFLRMLAGLNEQFGWKATVLAVVVPLTAAVGIVLSLLRHALEQRLAALAQLRLQRLDLFSLHVDSFLCMSSSCTMPLLAN